MIRLENVTKSIGDTRALDGLSMSVPKGSIYGLMGLNGAGKTTVIRHIAGFLRQDEGNITVDGEPVYDNEELKKRIAVIPDELFFFRGYSMLETAKYYSHIYPKWNQDKFLKMAESFGLEADKNIGKFSKGMKKQAAFSLMIATTPDYLILDEPVDGIDPIVRHSLWRFIMEDVADREMTVLISSHNAKEMEDVCNYIGIMSKGKMVLEGDLLEMGDTSIEELFIKVLGERNIEEGGEL